MSASEWQLNADNQAAQLTSRWLLPAPLRYGYLLKRFETELRGHSYIKNIVIILTQRVN